ncbi:hypothetical protein BaRGS_00011991 [Batillaria attramentaria]|uniref:Sushi domain-containing protein n=1 Tax=Batillaria attramentaria TaxID=370345 RepID=A0ABD0LCU2_9CAEN
MCTGADDSNVWGSTCTHSCDYGFELRGSSSVTCGSNGAWSSSFPHCERKRCSPRASSFANGQMSCTNSNMYGSVCSFSCNSGYRLVGSSTNTCTGNGQWSSNQPRCDVVRCSNPSPFNDGNRRCTGADDSNIWGSTCTHSCDYGFELRESSSVTCGSNGAWSSSFPHCERKRCSPRASSFANGQMSCTNSNMYGSVCSFSCNSGYRLVGSSRNTCTGNGRWSSNQPRCDEVIVGLVNVSMTKPRTADVDLGLNEPTSVERNAKDEAVNTVPAKVYFVIKADLNLSVGSPLPPYVSSSNVGIVAAKINLEKKSLTGHLASVKEVPLNGPQYCQGNVSSTNPVLIGSLHDCEGTITVPDLNLSDGESLCADMEASAGGYYNLQDESFHSSGTQTFRNLPNSKRVCFLYDPTKPAHCSQTGLRCNSSSDSVLQLSTRLTRTPDISVHIQGWMDPIPIGGSESSVSGINKYRLEVHGVDVSRTTLSMQNAARKNTIEWESTAGGVFNRTVILPEEDTARLYAVILEVHDKAGNVAYARRLVLYDNTSTVLINSSASFQVFSANPSNMTAERPVNMTDTHFCLNWNGRFYNSELYHNNFLLPVNPDTGRQIRGDYDQQSGLLPVTGTDNVRGIVRFEIAFGVDGSPEPTFEAIPNVHAQSACLSEPLTHSETYRVRIRATDIMGNYEDDSVRLKVDLDGNAFLLVDTPGDKTGSTQPGLIIGGVIGAIALVSVAVIVIVIIRRKRRETSSEADNPSQPPSPQAGAEDRPGTANIYETLALDARAENTYATCSFSNRAFSAASESYENVEIASVPRRKVVFTILK